MKPNAGREGTDRPGHERSGPIRHANRPPSTQLGVEGPVDVSEVVDVGCCVLSLESVDAQAAVLGARAHLHRTDPLILDGLRLDANRFGEVSCGLGGRRVRAGADARVSDGHQLGAFRGLLGERDEGSEQRREDGASAGSNEAGVQTVGEQDRIDSVPVLLVGEDVLDRAVPGAPSAECDAADAQLGERLVFGNVAFDAGEQVGEGGWVCEPVLVGAGADAEVDGDEHGVFEACGLERWFRSSLRAMEVDEQVVGSVVRPEAGGDVGGGSSAAPGHGLIGWGGVGERGVAIIDEAGGGPDGVDGGEGCVDGGGSELGAGEDGEDGFGGRHGRG